MFGAPGRLLRGSAVAGVLLTLFLLAPPATTPVQAAAGSALTFNGSAQYLTFGPASALNTPRFTLEAWVRWTGGGLGTSTGYGGLANAIPLVTKGRAEADSPANLNMDYFLGIDAASGRLAGDFEDTADGSNHPVTGTTPLTTNTWHHVAASYDGTTWRLYLDGVLDRTLVVGAYTPESTSIQQAAVASALDSSGTPAGYFAGTIDEVRIWGVARTGAQILATRDSELTSGSGLLGRWGLDDGAGTVAADSIAGAPAGTLVGGPSWVTGYSFPVDTNGPPSVTLNGPGDQATGQSTSPTLSVTATDPEGSLLTVDFYGRPEASGSYTRIGTNTGVASGSVTSLPWPGRDAGQTYQWYVAASDGAAIVPSAVWTFATAPGADPVLVGAGDIADCSSGSNSGTATAAVIRGIAGNVFTAGDNTYPDGTLSEFTSCYDPSWGGPGGSIKARTRPAPGNHDWNTGTLNGYFGYFGHTAAGTTSYYSYDLGRSWHVVVLDSECALVAGGCSSTSPQVTWLRADLTAAAAASRHVIAIWHKPRFSSGDPAYIDTAVQPFWDVLYQFGADIIINGHEHIYERMAPLNAAGQVDQANGIREFTIGTGGAELMPFGTIQPASEAHENSTFGVLKLTLHSSSYDWQFLPVDGGAYTDAGSQTVGQAAQNQPPVVSGVTIAPAAPSTNDVLHATVTASDPEGDPLTYAYQWTRNGSDLAGATGSSLDLGVAGNGDRGDLIRVRVTASDGQATSAPVTSSAVTVADSAPTAGVSLDTRAPDSNATLTASATAADADGDPISLTFSWTVNGSVKRTTTGTSLSDTFDLSVAGNGDPGDTIVVSVTPSDGTASGATATDTATVAAQNQPPGAPSGLTATARKGRIDLKWLAPASDGGAPIAGYRILRGTSSGQETLLATVGVTTSYRDTRTARGVAYYYVVVAFNAVGDGARSNEVSATAR